MRKLIAITSVTASFVFALALATADDMTNENMPGTTSTPAVEQPQGMTGDTSDSDIVGERPTYEKKSQMQASREKQIRSSKTCMDQNGVTYRKGQTGFERCIQSKIDQLSQTSEEDMGGTQADSMDKSLGESE